MAGFSKKSSRTKGKKKNSKQNKSRRTKRQSVKRSAGPKSKTRNRSSHTTSKTQTVTPTKEHSDKVKLPKNDKRADEFKEKEQESEGKGEKTRTDSVSKSKGSQVIPSAQVDQQAKKVEVTNCDPDEKTMKRLLRKLQKERSAPKPPPLPLDEKSKLLMDRVEKKPFHFKYRYRKKSNEALLMDEKSSFFKVTVPLKNSTSDSKKQEEDHYENYPKLADVLKMKPDKVLTEKGVPFWIDCQEAVDSETKDDDFTTVGSEHIEALQKKEVTLKTVDEKDKKVTMDPFLGMSELRKRDEKYFHEHLVFSNTLRSLINVQNVQTSEPASASVIQKRKESKTLRETKTAAPFRVRIAHKSPERFVYSRTNRCRFLQKNKSNTNVTTTGD